MEISVECPSNFKYLRLLGWMERDDEGEECDASIVVVDANIGYNVMRTGRELEHLFWCKELEEAIEYAVFRVHKEYSWDEIRQQEGK